MSIQIDKTITNLMGVYHCPRHIAVRLYHREGPAYRCVHRLGPMRIYWKAGRGWMLYNRPIQSDLLRMVQLGWEANNANVRA